MAIIATYRDPSMTLLDAYIKITRVWGSKQEGWNAWVGVYKTDKEQEYATIFSIRSEYVDGVNPFDSLYKAVANLDFILNPMNDATKEMMKLPVAVEAVVEEVVQEAVQEVVQEAPKKKRSKK